jgi:hypothetical protein
MDVRDLGNIPGASIRTLAVLAPGRNGRFGLGFHWIGGFHRLLKIAIPVKADYPVWLCD